MKFLMRIVDNILQIVGRPHNILDQQLDFTHRFRKSKIDCLRFVMCLLQASFSFFAVAINSTNEADKAGSMCL